MFLIIFQEYFEKMYSCSGAFIKEIACNEVAGFQVSALMKVNFFTFTVQNFVEIRKIIFRKNLFQGTHFSGWFRQFLNLFLLSCKRVSKTVVLLRKLQNVLARTSKLLIRPHLDHGNIIHDLPYNFFFQHKLESFQQGSLVALLRFTIANPQPTFRHLIDHIRQDIFIFLVSK